MAPSMDLVFFAGDWSSSITLGVLLLRLVVDAPCLMAIDADDLTSSFQISVSSISAASAGIQSLIGSLSSFVHLVLAASVRAFLRLSSGEMVVLATFLKISMSMSTASLVSPLTGVTVSLSAVQSSSDARRRASDSVRLGWVRYLCLKKTV